MNGTPSPAPQGTALFRVIAFMTRFQLRNVLRSTVNAELAVIGFVFLSGVTALATITLAALVTRLPLLFPPLGPSAFILFHTPMSVSASPRNVVLSHALALAAGLASLHAISAIYLDAGVRDPAVMNLYRVLTIAMAMALTSTAMIRLRCAHPPAAATALIAAMGHLTNAIQILGLLAAVVLLVVEAVFFNRVLGGLPYPLWQADPAVCRTYGVLAGMPDAGATFWQRLAAQILKHR